MDLVRFVFILAIALMFLVAHSLPVGTIVLLNAASKIVLDMVARSDVSKLID